MPSRRTLVCVLAVLAIGWGAGAAVAQSGADAPAGPGPDPTPESAVLVGADDAAAFVLPGASARRDGPALHVRGPAGEATYVDGIGWLDPIRAPAPRTRDGAVIGDLRLAAALGIDLTRIEAIRFGVPDGSGTTRVVFDVAGPVDPAVLGRVDRSGTAPRSPVDAPALGSPDAAAAADGAESALTLHLPAMLIPAASPPPYGRLRVAASVGSSGTEITLRGPAFDYDVFTLVDPVRIVVDVRPHEAAARPAAAAGPEASPDPQRGTGADRDVAPGIRYRRIEAPTPVGPSPVHIVTIAPGAAELRVVGARGSDADLRALASGGAVAINAGYFDPDAADPIGLVRIAGAWLGLPSRGRAAVAFGPDGTHIGRVEANLAVRVDGRSVVASGDAIRLSHARSTTVGRPDQGVIRYRGDAARARVASNTVGPVAVPPDGAALVYDPVLRDLARADAGETISIDVRVVPDVFGRAPYAVEAGPLLVEDGRPAFDPEREAFARGQRILDAYTQQAAVAVAPDGSTLLVVAERMRAEDLVPLFIELGVDAAMRLDSGGSAGLLVGDELVNASATRRIVTAIVAVTPPDEASAR